MSIDIINNLFDSVNNYFRSSNKSVIVGMCEAKSELDVYRNGNLIRQMYTLYQYIIYVDTVNYNFHSKIVPVSSHDWTNKQISDINSGKIEFKANPEIINKFEKTFINKSLNEIEPCISTSLATIPKKIVAKFVANTIGPVLIVRNALKNSDDIYLFKTQGEINSFEKLLEVSVFNELIKAPVITSVNNSLI